MSFRRVGVESVLHFDAYNLDFGANPLGLHVLYGPNEAGKSTLLRILVDLLYGGRIDDDHLEMYESRSRIHGVIDLGPGQGTRGGQDLHEAGGNESAEVAAGLETASQTAGDAAAGTAGEFFISRRRKRKSLHLIDASEADVPEELLLPYLGAIDRNKFTLLFGLDHNRLRAGGDSLLQSGGHAGISLFEAGGGMHSLQTTLGGIVAQVDGLIDTGFRRNSAKSLNTAWNQYKELRDLARKAILRGDAWQSLREEVTQFEEQVQRLTAQIHDGNAERAKYERVQRNRAAVFELHEARRRLDSYRDVSPLSAELETQILEALDVFNQQHQQMERLKVQTELRRHQLEETTVDREVLDVRDELTRLHERLQQYSNDSVALPHLTESTRQQDRSIANQVTALQSAQDAAEVESLRVPYVVAATVRKLLGDEVEIERATEVANRQKGDMDQARRVLEQDLQDLGEVTDVHQLRLTLEEFDQSVDIDGELQTRNAELASRQSVVDRRLQGQSVWAGGSAVALAKLAIPLLETVDYYVQADRQQLAEQTECKQEIQRLEKERTACIHDIEALALSGYVPVEADLVAARKRRDEGWLLIKQAWLQGEPVAAEPQSPRDVAAFEAAMMEADATADWMRKESERSAHRAQLLLRREQLQRELERQRQRQSELAQAYGETVALWKQEWPERSLEPKRPDEMKDWIVNVYRPAVADVQALEEISRRIEWLEAQRREWMARLRTELGVPEEGQRPNSTAPTLRQLVLLARERIADMNNRIHQRTVLSQRLEEQLAKLAQWDREAEQRANQKRDVAAAWSVLRAEHHHLPADLTIAAEYLDKLKALFEAVDQRDAMVLERAVKESACAQFEQTVLELAGRIGPALDDSAACAQWVRRTQERISEAVRVESTYQSHQRELEHIQEEADAVQVEHTVVTNAIERFQAQLGCTEPDGLLGRVEQSQQRRLAVEQVDKAVQRVQSVEMGMSLAEVEAELAAAPASDEVQARLLELGMGLSQLSDELAFTNQALGGARHRLAALDGTTADAANLEQQAESQLTEVDARWNEYIRLELSRRLLQRAMEDFRKDNESEILGRASELFSRLTVGNHPELAIEYDGATPFLQSVGRDGVRRRVGQMSDGTRDQLYLALRLAFVEQQLADGAVLPFIMDDILVHSDDERTLATLEVLAELGRHTQVLYFTHHRSVVDAARGLSGRAAVNVHEIHGQG